MLPLYSILCLTSISIEEAHAACRLEQGQQTMAMLPVKLSLYLSVPYQSSVTYVPSFHPPTPYPACLSACLPTCHYNPYMHLMCTPPTSLHAPSSLHARPRAGVEPACLPSHPPSRPSRRISLPRTRTRTRIGQEKGVEAPTKTTTVTGRTGTTTATTTATTITTTETATTTTTRPALTPSPRRRRGVAEWPSIVSRAF